MKRVNRWPWLIVILVMAIVMVVIGLRYCGSFQRDSIWFADRYYTVQELFPDAQAAALAGAAGKGDRKEINRLLTQGANPNYIGIYEYTPMMWTIEVGSVEGFQCLLERGARLDIPNHTTMSAMALVSGPACDRRFLEIALKFKGNPNFVEIRNGETPLFNAVRSGDEQRVKLLIAAGADVNAQNNKGTTALIECATTGQYKCAFLLLHSRADPYRAERGGADFFRAIELDRMLPFWSPNFWWRKKVIAELAVSIRNAEAKPKGAKPNGP